MATTKTSQIVFELKGVDSGFSETTTKAWRSLDDLNRKAQEISLKPLRADRGTDEQSIRDNVAQATRSARAESAARRQAYDAGGFDPNKEARESFSQTATAAKEASAAQESYTDKAVKVYMAVRLVHGAAMLTVGAWKLWNATLDDSKGKFREATEGYLGFADSVKRIPIVGDSAYELANMLSGGAYEAAKKTLADADAIDKHSQKIVDDRDKANREADKQIKKTQVEALDGEAKQYAMEKMRHEDALQSDKDMVERNKLGAEKAKELADAENKLHESNDHKIGAGYEDRYTKANAEIEAGRLKSAGKVAEAERVEFRESLREKLVAAEKLGAKDLDNQKFVNDEALKGFDAEQTKKASEAMTEAQKKADDILADAKTANLEGELDLHKKINQATKEKLDIDKEINQRREKLLEILKDEKTTADQKRRAQADVNDLPGEELRRQLAADKKFGGQGSQLPQFASSINSQFIAGQVYGGGSDPISQTAKNTGDGLTVNKQSLTALQDIATKLGRMLTQNPQTFIPLI